MTAKKMRCTVRAVGEMMTSARGRGGQWHGIYTGCTADREKSRDCGGEAIGQRARMPGEISRREGLEDTAAG